MSKLACTKPTVPRLLRSLESAIRADRRFVLLKYRKCYMHVSIAKELYLQAQNADSVNHDVREQLELRILTQNQTMDESSRHHSTFTFGPYGGPLH